MDKVDKKEKNSWSLQNKDRQIKRKGQNEQKQRKTVGANIGRRARHREGPRACGLLRARFARHGLRRHYWCHPGVRQAGRGGPQGRARVEGSAPERTKTLLFEGFVAVMKFYYFFIFLPTGRRGQAHAQTLAQTQTQTQQGRHKGTVTDI